MREAREAAERNPEAAGDTAPPKPPRPEPADHGVAAQQLAAADWDTRSERAPRHGGFGTRSIGTRSIDDVPPRIDRNRPVLHMPDRPAAPRGPVAFDESYVAGPPVKAGGPATLAGRLAEARAAGLSLGPRPTRPQGSVVVPAAAASTDTALPPVSAPEAESSDAAHAEPGLDAGRPAMPGHPESGARASRTRSPSRHAPGASFSRPPTKPSGASGASAPTRAPGHGHRPRLARPVRWTAQGVVLAAVVATTGGFTLYHRNLTLDVDGTSNSVDAYGWTVGEVLAEQGVHVKPGDVVVPSVSSPARGVDEVVVQHSRMVQIEINGDSHTVRTTASTVGQLLEAMGDRDAASYSAASRSEPIGRTPIRLVTSKKVHVLVDGQDLSITTSAATVGDVLAKAGVKLGSKDTTSAPLGAAAVDQMVVIVNRGTSAASTETEVLKFGTKKVDDATLPKGQTVVQSAGRVGTVVRKYAMTTKGGVEVSRKLVKQETVAEPVDEVVRVGTMVVPDPSTVVVSPGSAQAIAKAMVAGRGWSSAQFSCLVSLWNRESGWNATAENPSSGAYGIPQSLPGSKMASAGADWRTNAKTQITWGLDYIAGRYGTPCGAWGNEESVGSY
jgi:uncharacterized protein YabE (DUF348 family)